MTDLLWPHLTQEERRYRVAGTLAAAMRESQAERRLQNRHLANETPERVMKLLDLIASYPDAAHVDTVAAERAGFTVDEQQKVIELIEATREPHLELFTGSRSTRTETGASLTGTEGAYHEPVDANAPAPAESRADKVRSPVAGAMKPGAAVPPVEPPETPIRMNGRLYRNTGPVGVISTGESIGMRLEEVPRQEAKPNNPPAPSGSRGPQKSPNSLPEEKQSEETTSSHDGEASRWQTPTASLPSRDEIPEWTGLMPGPESESPVVGGSPETKMVPRVLTESEWDESGIPPPIEPTQPSNGHAIMFRFAIETMTDGELIRAAFKATPAQRQAYREKAKKLVDQAQRLSYATTAADAAESVMKSRT